MKAVAFFALALLVCLVQAGDGEAEPPASGTCSKDRYGTGSYEYDEETGKGPSKWGDLKPEYEKCKTGKLQSPFNVLPDTTYARPGMAPMIQVKKSVFKYKPTTRNFQLDCAKEFGQCSDIWFKGKNYSMLQVHLHSPSEYHIGGTAYPLSAHFVHQSGDGSLAVLGLFFDIGKANNELQKLLESAKEQDYRVVDLPKLVKPMESKLCAFHGSLTTPPCSEGVQWFLSLGIVEASLEQVGLYRAMVGEAKTNRPLEPSNDRRIVCYPVSRPATRIPGIL